MRSLKKYNRRKKRFQGNRYLLYYHRHLNVSLVVEWGRLERLDEDAFQVTHSFNSIDIFLNNMPITM